MRWPVKIALAVVLVALAGLISWHLMSVREPVYKGRPVSAWIKIGYLHSRFGLQPNAANEAVLAIGTNALPYYLEMLKTKGDSQTKIEVLGWVEKQRWLKLDFSSWHASARRQIGRIGIGILGKEAKPAFQELTELLKSGDDSQKLLAAGALTDIGLEGISQLTNVVNNPKANGRTECVMALSLYPINYSWFPKPKPQEEIDTAEELVVPVLVSCLNDADLNVRLAAIQSLGFFGRKPNKSVPALAEILNSADVKARLLAIQALQRCLGMAKAAGVVADYKVAVTPAISALNQALNDNNLAVRAAAKDVLAQIDSEADAKAGVK